MKRFIFLLLLAAGLMGCSTQNRESKPLISDEELMKVFDEMRTGIGSQDVRMSSIDEAVLRDPTATIFYHTRESQGAPASTVFSITDMSVLSPGEFEQGVNSWDVGIVAVDVIFLDTVSKDGARVFSLMARTQNMEGLIKHYSFTSQPGDYSFSKDAFETSVLGPNNTRLILRSNDISEDFNQELADSVKLRIYLEEGGQIYYVGQISTMSGYGNR
jgi:hypothetical protein